MGIETDHWSNTQLRSVSTIIHTIWKRKLRGWKIKIHETTILMVDDLNEIHIFVMNSANKLKNVSNWKLELGRQDYVQENLVVQWNILRKREERKKTSI